MGNIFTKKTETLDVLSNDKFNIKNIQELKEIIGTVGQHHYKNNPSPLLREFENSNIDLTLFSTTDEHRDLFNTLLLGIRTNFMNEYMKENWSVNAFLDEVTDCHLKESLMKLDLDTELGNNEEDSSETREDVETGVGINTEYIYRGYCIYELPENTMIMALDMKEISWNACFLGQLDNRFVFLAPGEEPDTTRHVRMDWTCRILPNQTCELKLESVQGVLYREKVLTLVNGCDFSSLDSAFQSCEKSNSREMSQHINKFKSWLEEAQKNDTVMAYTGGESEGDILALRDFLERLELD